MIAVIIILCNSTGFHIWVVFIPSVNGTILVSTSKHFSHWSAPKIFLFPVAKVEEGRVGRSVHF